MTELHNAASLNYSAAGMEVTKSSEGCRLVAYIPAPGDVPTIGYGHTKDVHLGMTCDLATAEAWLFEDVQGAVSVVRKHVSVPVTQGEFDALVDFVFNLGAAALIKSTLLRKLNAGDYSGAADEFEKWTHCNGRVLAGLVKRRAEEREEFNGAS